MATLIEWGNSAGETGRCDARCHEAEQPQCDCICGGYYHGAARDGSLEEKVKERGNALLDELVGRGEIRPTQGFLL